MDKNTKNAQQIKNWTADKYTEFGKLISAAGDLLETRGGDKKVLDIMTTKLMTPSKKGKEFWAFNIPEIKDLTITQMKALTKKCTEAIPKKK